MQERAKAMSHKLLADASFFAFIEEIDRDRAAELQREACPRCGSPLDQAPYWRKPRGDPRAELGQVMVRRPSLCCRRDGCRRRLTPPQLRFLPRRCYLAAVVVLATAIASGETAARRAEVARLVGASPSTVSRWLSWWRERFPASPLWRERRGRLTSPVDELSLPASLLAVFERMKGGAEAVVGLLRFLSLA
jgi:hypothetical protein